MTDANAAQSSSHAQPNDALFVFGSLMDLDVQATVLGHDRAASLLVNQADLPGYRRHCVAGEVFPVLVKEQETVRASVQGLLLQGLASDDWEKLSFFEGPAYQLSFCNVELGAGERRRRTCARVFLATHLYPASPSPWDYDHWRQQEKPLALGIAAETMALYGHVASESLVGPVWDGIKARALARLAVQGRPPHAAH